MELQLTTKRALKFEEKTGKDLLEYLQTISNAKVVKLKDIISIFECLGDGYDIDKFDAWDIPLSGKIELIMSAIKVYAQGKN